MTSFSDSMQQQQSGGPDGRSGKHGGQNSHSKRFSAQNSSTQLPLFSNEGEQSGSGSQETAAHLLSEFMETVTRLVQSISDLMRIVQAIWLILGTIFRGS